MLQIKEAKEGLVTHEIPIQILRNSSTSYL